MKLKKLTAALALAGFAGGALGAAHQPTPEQTFTLGANPQLTQAEEAMIVAYEGMLSIFAAWVGAAYSGCLEMASNGTANDGRYPFLAELDFGGNGSIAFGADLSDQVVLDVAPIMNPVIFPADRYGRKYTLTLGQEGVPYFHPETEYLRVKSFTTDLPPAFSAGGAIYVTSAHFDIAYNSIAPPSTWDEHIIKDFYRLYDAKPENDPACTDIGAPSTAPGVCNERSFYDWGLEAITKVDYPFYKWRQDSVHTPWNSEVGNWTIRKQLITPNAQTDDQVTYCEITASGRYFAGIGPTFDGVVTVSAPQ